MFAGLWGKLARIVGGALILLVFADAPSGFIKLLIMLLGLILIAWGGYDLWHRFQRSQR